MSHADKLNVLIEKLIGSTDSEEIRRLYGAWAETYDGDLDGFGYVAPQIGTAMFDKLMADKNAPVLDAGCGTGLVGQYLAQKGFTQIHGADFSKDMLAKARTLDSYDKLVTADFCAPLNIETDVYSGLISIGVYASRFKAHFLPEMLRILKPNGPMVFSCRPHYFESDVEAQLNKMQTDQSIIELSVIEQPYMQAQNANAHYISFRKKA